MAPSPKPVPDNSAHSVAPCRSSCATPGRSGRREASTDSHAGTSGNGSSCGAGGGGSGASATTFSARSSVPRRRSKRDDGVDDAVPLQVLRCLNAFGKRLAVEVLVDARAEESDERARLRDRDVSQRPPRREHAAGGRVPQVDQVGEMRALVQLDGGGDLDHLQERDSALLHAGAARARRRQQRQPFGGRPRDGGGDPFGRGHPDRTGEEVELARHHRHAPPEDAALAR